MLLPPSTWQISKDEQQIYELICRRDGILAREIGDKLGMERKKVNHYLFSSPLMHELCYQDKKYAWHGLIQQQPVHDGLYDFSGYYGTVQEFRSLSEDNWLSQLKAGCERIGRNLNDTRGLIHSFLDCRTVMLQLFTDLDELAAVEHDHWEIVFELRIKRGYSIRIYTDVLLISARHIFSLEFKMKDHIDPSEVFQAAKYKPYLQIIFGSEYEIIPALVLTRSSDLFERIEDGKEALLICSGDMLFNVLNDKMGFLK